MIDYVGPAPFLLKTVKGELEVMTDVMTFGGNTIGQCPVCDASAPLIEWIFEDGIGNRRAWREPEAEKEFGGKGHWFYDDGQPF